MMLRKVYWMAVIALLSGCATPPAAEQYCVAAKAQPELSAHSSMPRLGIRVTSSSANQLLLPSSATAVNISLSNRTQRHGLPLAINEQPNIATLSGQHLLVRDTQNTDPHFVPNYSYRMVKLSYSETGSALQESYQPSQLTDSRLWKQVASNFNHEISSWWIGDPGRITEVAPTSSSMSDSLSLQRWGYDPFAEEKQQMAWSMLEHRYRKSLRRSAKDSDLGERTSEQMKDWRDKPANFLFAIIGGGVEQETPEGGRILFGPAWGEAQDSEGPSQVVRLRYENGPLEARALHKEAWARLKYDLGGYIFFGRSKYKYLNGESSYDLGVNKQLAKNIDLVVIGGNGLGSESLTGYSPYPEDPRAEQTRFGLIAEVRTRF